MSSPRHRFEQAFAQWLGVPHAFAFWKGRVALYAILRAMGIGAGDEVILPGYTCVVNANPVKYLGAKPVYVDIDPITYNINPDLIAPRITPRTKVIIAQHTYGIPCQMDAILSLAGRRGIPVIEDCCLAMGPTYKGKRCGTFGLAAYWSFQWNKPFTTGIGGLATTSDASLAGKIEELCRSRVEPPLGAAAMLAFQRMVHRMLVYPSTTALVTRLFRWLTYKGMVVGSFSTNEFTPVMPPDFFMAMGQAQSRAGLRRMHRLEANLAHRRRLGALYDELLAQAGWPMTPLPASMDPVLVRYPVRVADKDKAVAGAPKARVELGTWFECPLHPKETQMSLYDYYAGMCPVAERAAREVVNLPTHVRAGPATAQRGVEFLRTIGPAR
jgi:dTDP-4-amino-4,6-dideoxygalactose transaminase